MTNEILKRTGQAILTIFAVISLTFALIRLMPGGPMQYLKAQLIQRMKAGEDVDMDQINALIEVYVNVNPEKPLLVQYVNYIGSILHGDFGKSIWYQEPVAKIIAGAAPWTVFLMSISLFLTFAIGIITGAFMAYSEGSRFDMGTTIFGMILNSIPYYIMAILLVYVLGYILGWLPTGGQMTPNTTPGLNWPFIAGVLEHAFLPIVSLVVTGWGGWALGMRGNSIQVLGEDYLRVARLRGLRTTRIGTRYVARNAVLPLYTGFVIAIGFVFGGSIILEQIFTYPGLGYYMFKAVAARDYPLMMGAFMVITFAVVIAIFVADLTYVKIDPRAGGEDREAY